MDKLLQLYLKLLKLHIGTKSSDLVFHQASEGFYDLAFDVFHTISEKRQDLMIDTPLDCEYARTEAYDALDEMKSIVEDMIKEKNSFGMDNLLRGLADKLETEIGTARGLADEESEEEDKKPGKIETKKSIFNK